MIFCGITLLPGERKTYRSRYPDAPSLNALCLCGAAPGKTLVVTAGVHGCEYVGIQALAPSGGGPGSGEAVGERHPTAAGKSQCFLCRSQTGGAGGRRQFEPSLPRQLCGPPFRSIGLCPGGGFIPGKPICWADLHSGDCSETLHPLVFFPAAGKKMVNQVSLDAAKVLTVPYRVRSTAKNGLYSWRCKETFPHC